MEEAAVNPPEYKVSAESRKELQLQLNSQASSGVGLSCSGSFSFQVSVPLGGQKMNQSFASLCLERTSAFGV